MYTFSADYNCSNCQRNIVFTNTIVQCQCRRIRKNVIPDYMPDVVAGGELLSTKLKLPSLLRTRNNLKTTIMNRFGPHSFTNDYYWEPLPIDTDDQIVMSQHHRLSRENEDVVLNFQRNYNYMPLSIVPIPGKGQGVIAMKDLPRNCYIGSYVGELRRIETVDMTNDSLLDIGKPFIIAPEMKLNHGRFLNGEIDGDENCRIIRAVSRSRIEMLLVTNRRIQRNEELTWEYSGSYWE